MKCKKCGQEISDTAKFCLNCGEKIIVEESAPIQKTEEVVAPEVPVAPVEEPPVTPVAQEQVVTEQPVAPVAPTYVDTSVNQAPANKSNKGLIIALCCTIGGLILIGLVILVIFNIMQNSAPREKIYLTEQEQELIFTQPAAYKSKYVKLTGQVSIKKLDKKNMYLTITTDMKNYTNDIVVEYSNLSVPIKENDYVRVEGYIKGVSEGYKVMPYIVADSVEVITYKDAATPTIKEVEVNKTISQNDVTVTISKVEFAKNETRVYVSVSNGSKTTFSLSSAKLVQNSKQYEESYSKNAEDIPYQILAGSNAEGVLTFPGVDVAGINVIFDHSYSSDYHINFDSFSFVVDVK